jgi:hypothetical protein
VQKLLGLLTRRIRSKGKGLSLQIWQAELRANVWFEFESLRLIGESKVAWSDAIVQAITTFGRTVLTWLVWTLGPRSFHSNLPFRYRRASSLLLFRH